MSYRRIRNVSAQVERVLESEPETRNDDVELALGIWRRFYPQLIVRPTKDGVETGREYVEMKNLHELPTTDAISRVRRKFQEAGKHLPTKESVVRARKQNIDEWRVAMGYPTQQTSGTPSPSWRPPSER